MSSIIFEPGKFFPQCHASCILPLDDGRILIVYFAGEHEKADDVGIWLSEYDGAKWLEPRCIAKLCGEPHWNPVLFKTADGVRIVFKVGREIRAWRSMTMLSRDGGHTWSAPHGYENNPAGGPVRSHPIRLSSGAWLAPNSDEDGAWRPRVDVSHDEGETFERLSDIPLNTTDEAAPDYLPGLGAIQPTLWESAPGHVHALLRTTGGYVYRSDSDDYGRTWSRARKTDIPNNNSGIDVAKAPDGRLFLALNPVSGNWGARTPLSVYVSEAGGESFHPYAVLADDLTDKSTGKPAEFSYPSLYVKGDTLMASYTYNRRSVAFWCARI